MESSLDCDGVGVNYPPLGGAVRWRQIAIQVGHTHFTDWISPAWHRFLNSDQGADPNSLNQMAYAWGNPMMVTDSSGMAVQTHYCVYCADRKYDNPVCFDNLVSASAALRNLQNVFHNCRIIYPGTATVVVSAPPWWVTPVGYELSIPSDQLQPLGPSPLTGSPGNLPPPQSPQPPKRKTKADCYKAAAKAHGVPIALTAISLASGVGEIAAAVGISTEAAATIGLGADLGNMVWGSVNYDGSRYAKGGLASGAAGLKADTLAFGQVKGTKGLGALFSAVGEAFDLVGGYNELQDCLNSVGQ